MTFSVEHQSKETKQVLTERVDGDEAFDGRCRRELDEWHEDDLHRRVRNQGSENALKLNKDGLRKGRHCRGRGSSVGRTL